MDQTQDRRTHSRLLCADLIEVTWHDANGRERRRIANLEDICSSGMSLQLETAMPDGTPVRLRCGELEMGGVVRYVLFRDGAFFIGIELDEESRWSSERFAPEHLLDPKSLGPARPLFSPAKLPAPKWLN